MSEENIKKKVRARPYEMRVAWRKSHSGRQLQSLGEGHLAEKFLPLPKPLITE